MSTPSALPRSPTRKSSSAMSIRAGTKPTDRSQPAGAGTASRLQSGHNRQTPLPDRTNRTPGGQMSARRNDGDTLAQSKADPAHGCGTAPPASRRRRGNQGPSAPQNPPETAPHPNARTAHDSAMKTARAACPSLNRTRPCCLSHWAAATLRLPQQPHCQRTSSSGQRHIAPAAMTFADA
jgi:hypothetical protein